MTKKNENNVVPDTKNKKGKNVTIFAALGKPSKEKQFKFQMAPKLTPRVITGGLKFLGYKWDFDPKTDTYVQRGGRGMRVNAATFVEDVLAAKRAGRRLRKAKPAPVENVEQTA